MELPAYFIVGARPVKAVPTPDGGLDVLAYDWKTGDFVREMGCLARITFPEASEADFDRAVAALRAQRPS